MSWKPLARKRNADGTLAFPGADRARFKENVDLSGTFLWTVRVNSMMKSKKGRAVAANAETPQEIYAEALRVRKSNDPLDKRHACEKGWLAAVEAVDEFLATKGKLIPKGDPDAHSKRREALDDLVVQDPSFWELRKNVNSVADNLHAQCFYAGKDSPAHDRDLKKTVREILEQTGHPVGDIDE